MKLILYSGGKYQENRGLNRELFRLSGVTSPRMVYIPSENNELDCYFIDWKNFYLKMGASECLNFPLKKNINKELIKKAFSSHIIFLSGGNTFTFLNNLKKSGLKKEFLEFIGRGGVLAGMSAGSILMTPSIHMAEIPSNDQDDNDVRLTDYDALNLVNFEFSPHYEYDTHGDRELKLYSLQNSKIVYGCEDGSGLIIEGQQIRRLGKIWRFINGNKEKVTAKSWSN